MQKVFVDTNFIIDLVARPEFSGLISDILSKGRKKGIDFSICFLSLANYAYIDRKKNKKELYENLRMLCKVFRVIPNNLANIEESISLEPKDFEDAIQYCSALMGKCECIITRNKKDFISFSQIPIFTPIEFLEFLKREKEDRNDIERKS